MSAANINTVLATCNLLISKTHKMTKKSKWFIELVTALNLFGVSDEKAKKIAAILADPSERKFFKLSVSTPFTESELEEYSVLTGKSFPEIEKIMETYSNAGINSLYQINQIIKIGHYCG